MSISGLPVRRLVPVGATLALALAGAVANAPGAQALTNDQILAQCGSGIAKCTYEDVTKDGKQYKTKPQRVSAIYQNCQKSGDLTYQLKADYTNSVTTGFTIGGSGDLSLGTPAGTPVALAVKGAIQGSYNKSWTDSKTVSAQQTVTVSPGKSSWIEVSAIKDVITGTLKTNYDAAVAGHYHHLLPNQKMAVPPINGAPQDVITVKSGKADCSKGTGTADAAPAVVF
ncbi:hypothetical protein ACH4YO_42140 [Streptomyces noursei]|uniref:hypothetical protein n=1 Tax=Streptomyces noursei TaxID=1971 RepID=UPI0033DEB1B2